MDEGILLLPICAFIACYRVNFTFTTHKPVYSVITGQSFKVYDRIKIMSHNFNLKKKFVCNLLNVAVYATWLVNETDQTNSTQVTTIWTKSNLQLTVTIYN